MTASYRAMADHLPGPLGAAVHDEPVPLDTTSGRLVGQVPATAAPPLLLLGPGRDLAEHGLRVTVTAGSADLPPLVFAPWTEADALLPVPGATGSFEVRAEWLTGKEALSPAEAADLLRARCLAGTTARLLYVLGAPKADARRVARQIAASRTLDGARGDALDRLGAEVDAPRFAERITVRGDVVDVTPGREPDEEYRARLAVLRQWTVPSPGGMTRLLTDGPLARFRMPGLFAIEDSANGLALAFRVLAPAGDAGRIEVLEQVRAVHLLWPGADGDAVHAARSMPAARRARDEALRAALRERYTFTEQATNRPALARGLAAALARLAACRAALGTTDRGTVLRVQDPAGGSRYELGVGADLRPLTVTELERLADRARRPGQVADPEIRALLAALRPPRAVADDPDGRWLLEPCGLATVHRLADDRLFVSHLPLHGMAVDGDPSALRARYAARQDEYTHAVLGDGLTTALRAWTAMGGGLRILADRPAALARMRAEAQALDATDPALTALRAAGLPTVSDPRPAIEQLPHIPQEMYQVVTVPEQLGQRFLSGQPDAVDLMRGLVGLLRDQWLVSALPVVLAPAGKPRELALVLGAVPLPQAGTNLNRRRAAGFRWQTVPLRGSLTLSATTGASTSVTTTDGGIGVAVAVGYARRQRTDPYEFSVDLPDGTLNHPQYEALMNLLDRAHPAGIAVDTLPVRRSRVALGPGPEPTPLSPAQSRLYRNYRPGRGRLANQLFKPITAGLQVGVRATLRVDTYLKPRQGNQP
ncbi:hypothetical protein ACFYWX_39665 [Streptomyces sp. NPDC002888]|uniref:hypothetical protein n=1 Tax=Streptomyces sp. NPDC002888 TaxID=3364668 RepID=UPI0036822BEC